MKTKPVSHCWVQVDGSKLSRALDGGNYMYQLKANVVIKQLPVIYSAASLVRFQKYARRCSMLYTDRDTHGVASVIVTVSPLAAPAPAPAAAAAAAAATLSVLTVRLSGSVSVSVSVSAPPVSRPRPPAPAIVLTIHLPVLTIRLPFHSSNRRRRRHGLALHGSHRRRRRH